MIIRVSFLFRNDDGTVALDGFEVDPEFHTETLPRIGEHVVLPDSLASIINGHPKQSGVPQRRFEVVSIDHYWHRIVSAPPYVTVYISTLAQPPGPFRSS